LRKGIFTILIVCLFYSCEGPKFALGISEQYFLNHHGLMKIKLEESTLERTVYKYGYSQDGNLRYYYFENGILKRIDGGVLMPNIRIDATIHK
jgi:hypothetical protein